MNHPKRLIEVDLPIKRISAHARREKSIRHGHISTLHIWWARRPLAACRAVICASLWPDPADPNCPQAFRDTALKAILEFAKATQTNVWSDICDPGSWQRYMRLASGLDVDVQALKGQQKLRSLLLDFIADFAAWEASTNAWFLDTARTLTQAAHEALGGEKGTRPLVVDPFAGGGAIPLEALRVGADAFASDLNPVAVLLNKVVLEYIPKYGQKLADEVRRWGQWVEDRAKEELAEFYPSDRDGSTPIAYLWARTITCEGPSCGAVIPLLQSLWLGKKPLRPVGLKLEVDRNLRRIDIKIVEGDATQSLGPGTVKRGSATCPCCGYTTPVASVRQQLRSRAGGARDARMFAVVTTRITEQGRFYREANPKDVAVAEKAGAQLGWRIKEQPTEVPLVPQEPLPPHGTLGFRVQLYGIMRWGDLFSPRQLLALTTLCRLVGEVRSRIAVEQGGIFADAVQCILAMNVDKVADYGSTLASWSSPASQETVRQTFGRMALPIVWDFAEAYPFAESSGGWMHNLAYLTKPIEHEAKARLAAGSATSCSATAHPLPDGSAAVLFTDPPYYDAIPYADLSDFFIVWLRRSLIQNSSHRFSQLAPKEEECVMDASKGHDHAFFLKTMEASLRQGRRYTQADGLATVVFAHKSTSGWEAQLGGLIAAGWTITGSWPLDTEREGRMRANSSAALTSSVHLVCRPRYIAGTSRSTEQVGDWRDVLAELPKRIREWMGRLSSEGVVGADAIFACLGPALEIFSRYSRVEKAGGDQVTLREFLEQVWGTVAKEALSLVFANADTRGFEADARLTAIWFWVLNSSFDTTERAAKEHDNDEDPEDEVGGQIPKTAGYVMDFDAARKLAQGLGVNIIELSQPGGILSIKGSVATLVGLGQRELHLVGRQISFSGARSDPISPSTDRRRNAKLVSIRSRKPALFDPLPPPVIDPVQLYLPGMRPSSDERPLMRRLLENGESVLDRLHQVMLLFGRGQSSLIGQFLTESGMASDQRFWKLAQALSALYPAGTDEKRWVDGVLARKKGLGL